MRNSLRWQLISQVLPAGGRSRPGRQPGNSAGRKGPAHTLAIEQLEDRCLPDGSPLQQVSLPDFTVPASDAAGGASQAPASVDGRFIAYTSNAPNLIAGQINPRPEDNIFLYHRQFGT